ncbi:MAG: hypothetical protein KIT84_19050 [Labilithrix sp.]|nr:hypothetical protein [Labilithrix sp.]MCW5813133.1 hypothetical protein [Labilithrix sp.]
MAFAIAALFLAACAADAAAPVSLGAGETPASSEKRAGDVKDDGDADTAAPANPEELAEALPASGPGEWKWLDEQHFDGAPQCMDGSKTGLGVNRSPTGSKKVLVFMMGGGACFDGQTCAIADRALSANHANAEDFATWSTTDGKSAVMNRERPENPFRDWNYVYVPYCSGDTFAGANPAGFKGRPQVGFKNVAAYLPRVVSTFRDADQLVLTGMSAGGYGAAYNFVQVQKAFHWLDVTMIDDSGPPLSSDFTTPCLQQKWKQTWLMEETSPVEGPFPLGFDRTSGVAGPGLKALVKEVIAKHPKNKFAFVSHEHDLVMRYFHGIGHTRSCGAPGLLSAQFFADGLRDIRTIDSPNFSTFYGPGSGHTYFTKDDAMYGATADGVALTEWLRQLVTTGDEAKRVPATF